MANAVPGPDFSVSVQDCVGYSDFVFIVFFLFVVCFVGQGLNLVHVHSRHWCATELDPLCPPFSGCFYMNFEVGIPSSLKNVIEPVHCLDVWGHF